MEADKRTLFLLLSFIVAYVFLYGGPGRGPWAPPKGPKLRVDNDANISLFDTTKRSGAKLMPRLGFGTCCRKSAKGQPLIDSTLSYIAQGGRLIDTAQMYNNHADLKIAIQTCSVARSELWITSKVNTYKGGVKTREEVARAVDKILSELGIEYIDLLLLHHATTNTADQRAQQWQALLDAKAAGKVRNAGVSNYDRDQLEALKAATGALPAVNQLEYHPWVPTAMHDLVKWCQSKRIAVTAYGSLGSSKTGAKVGTDVEAVARRHNVTTAALLLRWALNKGCAVIPGATSPGHIAENLHVKKFVLTASEEAELLGAQRPDSWRLWRNMAGDEGKAQRSRARKREK